MLDEALPRIKESAQKPMVGVGKVKHPGSSDGEELKD
jgi:hypothetical protein